MSILLLQTAPLTYSGIILEARIMTGFCSIIFFFCNLYSTSARNAVVTDGRAHGDPQANLKQ
jgi:hypothetical protein